MSDLEQLLDEAAGSQRGLDVDRVRQRVAQRSRRRAARRGLAVACVAIVAVVAVTIVVHERSGELQVGGPTTTVDGTSDAATQLFELTTAGPMTVDPATGTRTALDVGVS